MNRTIFRKTIIVDQIEVVHRDKDGNVISKRIINNSLLRRILIKLGLAHNSLTEVGFAACAALIGNVSGAPAAFQSIGIGKGTTAPPTPNTNTQLETSVKLKTSTTITRVTTDYTNDTLELIATFSNAIDGLTGIDDITEIGAFNGNLNGTSLMLLRQVYAPADVCNWDQGDTLQITVKVQCKQGS